MEIDCRACVDGKKSDDSTCSYCNGTGVIDLSSISFESVDQSELKFFMQQVWTKTLDELSDIKDKCNDIFEKVNEK